MRDLREQIGGRSTGLDRLTGEQADAHARTSGGAAFLDRHFLGNVHREDHGADEDLVALSVRMAETPMSPLYKRHVSPDRELRAIVEEAVR